MQRLSSTPAFQDRNLCLKGADIATQRGWTGVPNFILESKEISIGAKLTYAMLLKYARELDECFPGQQRLAKDMGNGVRSVVRNLDLLLLPSTRTSFGSETPRIPLLPNSFWSFLLIVPSDLLSVWPGCSVLPEMD